MPVSLRRTSVLLILGFILLTPWASAAELLSPITELRSGLTVPELWFREQIWGILARVWGKDGASADPKEEGQQAATDSLIKCENGGSIDPDGHCRP